MIFSIHNWSADFPKPDGTIHHKQAKKGDPAGIGDVQRLNENALCKKRLQSLRELGSEMGPSFLPELLAVFQQDAVEHLAVLRSAVAGGETGRLGREAHALKGASLTIGADGMAEICKQLEELGTSQSLEDAPAALECLDREFDRVKSEIEQESLIA